MLGKWKQRAIQMNFKKAVICFIVVSFIWFVISAVVYRRLEIRITEGETITETERESGFREHEDDDFGAEIETEIEQIFKELHLSASDIALIAGCGIIGVVLGIFYWLLCMVWVYRKSDYMDMNSALWVLATLFFNLAAILALYLYAVVRGTCKNCGAIKTNGGKFCDRCGELLKKECLECRQVVDVTAGYCSNCGKKLDQD